VNQTGDRKMTRHHDDSKKSIYQIKIHGMLDQHWLSWLNNMEASIELDSDGNPLTVLQGVVGDQSELRGLMMKIWDLNRTLISINRLEVFTKKGKPTNE
jgi:hypothetical protein